MKKLFIILNLCLVSFAYAESIILTLNAAEELAFKNNPELKRQKILMEAANRNARCSWNPLLPSMVFSASDNYIFPGNEQSNSINFQGDVSLNIRPGVFVDMEKAVIQANAESLNYQLLKNSIQKNICDSYFEILLMQEQIKLNTENLSDLEQLYFSNKDRFEYGFLNQVEYLNSKILYEKAKTELTVNQLEKNKLCNDFKNQIGIPSSTEIVLDCDLAEICLEYLSGFDEEKKNKVLSLMKSEEFPELVLLKTEKTAAQKNAVARKMDVFSPSFNLTYGANPTLMIADKSWDFKNSLTVSASIPLENLIPGSAQYLEIQSAKDAVQDFEIQIETRKNQMENEVSGLLLLLEQNLVTLNSVESLMELTESNLKICQESYSKGLLDFQSLKNTNSEFMEIKTEYFNLLMEILKNLTSIQQISGIQIN